jgi:hypothetical protein
MVGIIIPKNIAFQKIALNIKSAGVTSYNFVAVAT